MLFRSEMEREGFTVPLLIGGATTSKVHTAVKIAPGYKNAVVYVADASRAVGVAGSLMSEQLRDNFTADVKADYERMREAHARQQQNKKRQPIAAARANKVKIAWEGAAPEWPRTLGIQTFDDYDLAELITDAAFSAYDGSDADSYETQENRFRHDAHVRAFEVLVSTEAAMVEDIRLAFHDKIAWRIPAGTVVSLSYGAGPTRVQITKKPQDDAQ